MNVPGQVVRVPKSEFFQRYSFDSKRVSGHFAVFSANKVTLWDNKVGVRSGFRRKAANFRGPPATVCLISATVSVYKLTDQGLLVGAVVMVRGYGEKQWVVPVLEKIEMSQTNAGCNNSGTPTGSKAGGMAETPGNCAPGS